MLRISKVEAIARKNFSSEDWRFHVLKVKNNALQLAKFYKANREVVELAALLHDVARARSKHDEKNHHLIGAKYAKNLLNKLNYSQQTVDAVVHCIQAHRGSKGIPALTMEAKILANADAMSHFDIMPLFFYWRSEIDSFTGIISWLEEKLKRDWEKKLTLPKAKKLVAKKYKAIQILLIALC